MFKLSLGSLSSTASVSISIPKNVRLVVGPIDLSAASKKLIQKLLHMVFHSACIYLFDYWLSSSSILLAVCSKLIGDQFIPFGSLVFLVSCDTFPDLCSLYVAIMIKFCWFKVHLTELDGSIVMKSLR